MFQVLCIQPIQTTKLLDSVNIMKQWVDFQDIEMVSAVHFDADLLQCMELIQGTL